MLTKTITTTDKVRDILGSMTFEPAGRGVVGVLTCGQLDRDTYEATNKVLAALGGKWKRGKGHVFEIDPRPQIQQMVDAGNMTVAKDGYFPTPPAIVAQMLDYADLNPASIVLEPSAGTGHIADAIRGLGAVVHVIEQDEHRRDVLREKGHTLVGTDFLQVICTYDRIVMNPPFENGQDVEHVTHAWACCAPGGLVVAIMSEGIMFRQDRKYADFRTNILEPYGTVYDLPADAFKPSGTSVKTRLVVLEKE
jgi:predicted RNA methylase